MNDSENKNPNQYLIKVGIFIILAGIASVFLKSYGLIYFMGVGVRIIVIFWMPMAAKNVKRSVWGWTIIALITPPIAFIALGVIGYNPDHYSSDFFQEYNTKLKSKINELSARLDSKEISEDQYNKLLSDYKLELSNLYKNNYYNSLSEEELSEINKKLTKKGFVLDENHHVFVEVKDTCPACGAPVKETDGSCPECGLSL